VRNYQVEKREGIKIWKIMRAYHKNTSKRHDFPENEYHGEIEFIYYEQQEVEDKKI
jgi:hypothetical protein